MRSSAREPLLLPAVCFAAGILLWSWLQPDRGALWTGSVALASLWLLVAFRYPKLRWHLALVVSLASGAVAGSLQKDGSVPELDAAPGEVLLLSGCVTGPVAADQFQSRFTLELEPGARARVTLTTREGELVPAVHYGDRIEIEARIRKPRNFGNPGAFDFVSFLRRDSVYWLASARGVDKLHRVPGTCGSVFRRFALGIRETLSARIAHLYAGDEYAARLMPALLVGDNSGIDRSWTTDFRRTGTYHAIVISGLHITVVAGTVLILMRWLGLPLMLRLTVGAALAWLYAGVADWQPPVVRSALGFTLFLLASSFFREGRILNLLAATAIVLLAIDPAALFDPSFQLTFLSVAAIGALASPLMDRTFGVFDRALTGLADPGRDLHFEPRAAQFRIELRLLAETFALVTHAPLGPVIRTLALTLGLLFWILEMATVSACVQLALLVPMVVYFHQVSLTGVLANITVVPALSAAVPIGLLAAILGWSPLAVLASGLLFIARASTQFWASVEPGLRVPDPPVLLCIAVIGGAAVLGSLLTLQARGRAVACAALPLLVLAGLLIANPFRPDLPQGSLELTAIDVGQGDSLLVVFPDGRTLLVDGGGFPVFDRRLQARLDIGEDVVAPYLWRRGIHHLDAIAITHLHDDHAAGIPALIRHFHPAEVWTGAAPQTESPLLKAIRSAASDSGARISSLHRGIRKDYAGAEVKVLSPSPAYVSAASAHNNDSLVLLLSWGRHHFLLTGDAERGVESELVAEGLIPEIDVLKAGHHGSRSSTTPAFLEAARPLFALISVGEGNTYGHPYPDVIERLNGMGTRILRTDQNGLVQVRSDGKKLVVSRFADEYPAATAAVFDKGF